MFCQCFFARPRGPAKKKKEKNTRIGLFFLHSHVELWGGRIEKHLRMKAEVWKFMKMFVFVYIQRRTQTAHPFLSSFVPVCLSFSLTLSLSFFLPAYPHASTGHPLLDLFHVCPYGNAGPYLPPPHSQHARRHLSLDIPISTCRPVPGCIYIHTAAVGKARQSNINTQRTPKRER